MPKPQPVQRSEVSAHWLLLRLQDTAYDITLSVGFLRWMEACLGEELPTPTELEEALRNGVILAKLGHRFAPTAVAMKKIYDPEQLRYQVAHTHSAWG